MKLVGEVNINRLAQAKKGKGQHWQPSMKVACIICDAEHVQKEVNIRKYHPNGYVCYSCNTSKREEGKKEMNRALIALARRKGLIK